MLKYRRAAADSPKEILDLHPAGDRDLCFASKRILLIEGFRALAIDCMTSESEDEL